MTLIPGVGACAVRDLGTANGNTDGGTQGTDGTNGSTGKAPTAGTGVSDSAGTATTGTTTTSMTGAATTDPGTETGTGGVVMGFCEDSCASTSPGGCFDTKACLSYCEEQSPQWPHAVAQAFATCAADNPLCFETVEGCILSELHPEGSAFTILLTGAGFAAHEGKTVTAWDDAGNNVGFVDSGQITRGALAFEWVEVVHLWDAAGPYLLMYIDVDDNQICTAAEDLTASVPTVWNGDFLAPVFEAEVSPPLADPDFVCNFAP